jgi:hypothetical protein
LSGASAPVDKNRARKPTSRPQQSPERLNGLFHVRRKKDAEDADSNVEAQIEHVRSAKLDVRLSGNNRADLMDKSSCAQSFGRRPPA